MRVLFIGGGNMAGAMIGGLLAKGFAAADIRVVEVLPEARTRLFERYAVACTAAVAPSAAPDEVVIFAVKPQQIATAAAASALVPNANLVISIAAGLRLTTLSRLLRGHARLVRAMPNTPALIGSGVTGLHPMSGEVSREDRTRAEAIMGAVGAVAWIPDEAQMDVVTAVSGSGPAYVFWLAEQLAAFAATRGLEVAVARRLAIETILGAARLAAQSDEPLPLLRERVTSKGGTTEAALRVFAAEGLGERFERALEAARHRGAELGEQLDREA